MSRAPYATRHIGRLDAVLVRRFRPRTRVRPLSSRVPRWWTQPWAGWRRLSSSATRLQDARMTRLWAMAEGVAPLPPMLPELVRPVPPSWRADR